MSNREDVYTEERKGYTIRILRDDDGESPREWDNAGKMVCWHNGYNLGDEQSRQDVSEWLSSFMCSNCEKLSDHQYNDADDLTMDEIWNAVNKEFIFLPLYLYDHSGISISTSSFVGHSYYGAWDSGQVGFIYISKKDAVKEWGNKLFTKTVEEKAINYLVGEVKTYDDYLRGNIYGYIIEDEDGDNIDSCWGFYPEHNNKPDYDYCLIEARGVVDYEIKQEDNKKWQAMANNELVFATC